MAVFDNLYQVGRNLVDLLVSRIDVSNAQVGPPLDLADSTAEAIRITLLWLTPQPGHRNDPREAGPGGPQRPPLSLSGYYLVSTYGSASDDTIQAYNILGQVLQVFHTLPVLELPDAAVPLMGDGRLAVVHMPTDAELMERVYSSLQLGLRPWAILEVSPIQLRHLGEALPEPPVVRPGGVQLAPVESAAPPAIERVTPATVHPGGTIRIDAVYHSPVSVAVGGVTLPAAAVSVAVAGGPVFASLAEVTPGAYDVTLTAGPLTSPACSLTVSDPAVAGVQAPSPGAHQISGGDLTLDGQHLATSDQVILWPDQGLATPSDVVTLQPVMAAAGQVTVPRATVQAARLRPALYRVTVRTGPHRYTPWVLLAVRP